MHRIKHANMDPMLYAESMKKAGNQAFKNGNYALAIKKYDEAICVSFQLWRMGLCSRREMAKLLCSKSTAFFCLSKWQAAYRFAQEGLDWDPSFIKAYYRAGFSKFKLSAPDYAADLFIQGLIRLHGSQDKSQKVDFIVGIFMCINASTHRSSSIFKNLLQEELDKSTWQLVIEELARKKLWRSFLLLVSEKDRLPRNLRVTQLSLKNLFEEYVLCEQYDRIDSLPQLVEWLISIGANIGSIGAYPLHAIIKLCIKTKGNDLFRWLLDRKPDLKGSINQQDSDGCTVLHVVASRSNGYSMQRQTDDVQMLLNYGVDPTIADGLSRCAVDMLKKNKNFKAVDIINSHIARHPAFSTESPGQSESKTSADKTDCLQVAFEQFLKFCSPENKEQHKNLLQEKAVQSFLKKLSTVKEIPEDMVCDIHHACATNFIKLLLEKQMWHEVLLLLTGKANGKMSPGGGLIKNCDLSDIDIGSIIKQLDRADKRRVHLIRCLIERGALPEGLGTIQEKPLTMCLKNADFELAYLVLSSGADSQSVSIAEGDTPLHAAISICLDKKDEIGLCFLNYLLDCYSSDPSTFPHLNPNIQDKDGNTVMHIIFQKVLTKQVKKIIALLAKFDINLNLKNKLGKNARHRIKKTNPMLCAWNTALLEKKRHRQDTGGQPAKMPKPNPVYNTSQSKNTAHSLSASSRASSPSINSCDGLEKTTSSTNGCEEIGGTQLKQETGVTKLLTLRDHLGQAISDLIQKLELGDTPAQENSQIKPSSILTAEGKNIEPPQICGSERLSQYEGESVHLDEEGTEKEHDKSALQLLPGEEQGITEDNGQIQDIEMYIQDFDNMTWEIECTSEMLKMLGSKAVPPYLKKKIIMVIQQLGNGEWTQSLQKPLKHLQADIRLYEAKLNKGARILWELAIDFSPRCSEVPEKIIEMEQSKHPLEESGRIYTEIIRIWDIVLDHCKLDHAIKTICIAYNRGLSCILRKKLKGISKSQQSSNMKAQKRFPRCYVEDTEAEKSKDPVIPEYFPPASAVETEYNIMKFHSFSTNMALNILNDMNSAVEYPFRVGELEYAVIDLNPKPMEPIILIGRSGTGKTTCCLYRLWKKFHSYWERASIAEAPLLVRQKWQRRKFESEEENMGEEDEDEEENREVDDDSESVEMKTVESLADEQDNEDSHYSTESNCEVEEEQGIEELDKLEHLHQIFVTKNHVLCQEVQRNFVELSKSSKVTIHFKPPEPSTYKLQELKDENFPLFVTSKQLLLLLDASMPNPFFLRNEDGSLKRTIVGWSTQEDLIIPNWQEEDEDGHVEGEYVEDEKGVETQTREKDPRVFVTYDVFANEIWPKMVKGKTSYNPALVWKEIKSFLKGSFEALSCCQGKLTEEEYKKLGRKRAPNFKEDRSEIYHLFCLYQQIRSQRGYFDEEDVLYNLSQRLSKLEELPWSIHELYGDEIQDFTQAELAVLMKCTNNPNAMFLTGDTAQSIMKGVSFRFSDLRSLFHYASKNLVDMRQCVRKPKRIYQLYQNYRSHSGILRLASGVVDLLQYYFPESFDRLPRDSGLFDGPKPTVLESCSVSDLAILLRGNKRKTQPIEFGAHQVILVVNEMAKEKIPEELGLALVLTVYEAKGLEFDDVLLYNFFTDSEAYKEWKIISSFTPPPVPEESKPVIETTLEQNAATQNGPLSFNAEMYKMLNGELKQLYTAITRARVNLWIFDENRDKRDPAFKYFIRREFVQVVKTDENKDLDDSMFVKTSTPEEWIAQGEYYAKHQCWKVAAKCYQKGGADAKEKLALAHDAVLNVQSKKSSPKEKQMEYMSLAKTYLECGEPKLSLKCLTYAKEFQLCSELCKKLGKVKEAAYFYKKSHCYKEAARCYEQMQEFELALQMFFQEGLYEEAGNAAERYEEILRTHLSISSNELYLAAASKYLTANKPKDMMRVLSRLGTEVQLAFLKSHKCLAQAADLLKREGREEEAATLMKQHGFVLEAAKLTTKKEFRASCLLMAARLSVSGHSELENIEAVLEEALELCKQTNQTSGIAEAIFLQGVLKKDFTRLKDAFYKYHSLLHYAGMVEALFELTHCKAESRSILCLAKYGLEALLDLVEALQKATTNAEKEMVKSCFDYFGVLPIDGNLCQVSRNEGGHIVQILSDNPRLKGKKMKDHFVVGIAEVKSALKKHLLSRLCLITRSVLGRNYPDICLKFIAGLDCKDKTCEGFHRPFLRHEAKSMFRCKIDLAVINGLLLQAKKVFPEELLHESKDIDELLTADRYALCKSLVNVVFPQHFHLRVVSENPMACREILGPLSNVSKYFKMVLKEYITFKFKNESAVNRRESTDLLLSAMQVFILSSSYPEEFEKFLSREEEDYNKELKAYGKEKSRGKKPKGIQGRAGMLQPNKNAENAENIHLCFIRLLQNSLDQLYVNKNPEECKWLFFRFMNVLVKKCIDPLIPSIGNTVMLLEFQYILCCAVLMRLCKDVNLCLPKSYLALLHYWEFLFRIKKDQHKEVRDTFSIIQDYRPKDINKAVRQFKFHLSYVAEVLCGAQSKDFNVLVDAFGDPDYVTSGEAERTVVLCLVILVNADQVLNIKSKSLFHTHFLTIKDKLISMKRRSPSKVPERLVKIVEKVSKTSQVREIAEGLQELLTERDGEFLVNCRWRWDSLYYKGTSSVRGIFYEQINPERFVSSWHPVEYSKESEMEFESDLSMEEREDPLTAIACIKQQKQQQKASAERKLFKVFFLGYCYVKWRRKSCSKPELTGVEMEELVSGIFKKADIDRTQCDLCGIKFIQSSENYFSQTENLEIETSEAVTPTESDEVKKEENEERNAAFVATGTYERHRSTDEHKNKYVAYKDYFKFFRSSVDQNICFGRSIIAAIEEASWTNLAWKERSSLEKRKIQEIIKEISDVVKDIYERKAWAEGEEMMTKHVSELSISLDEAHKRLEEIKSYMEKDEGFAHENDLENEVENEKEAFAELRNKKSRRQKYRRR